MIRHRRFLSAGTALLAVLAFLCPDAGAVVIATARGDFFQFPPGGGNTMELDLDGNGTVDFQIAGGTGDGGANSFGLAVNATEARSTILGVVPSWPSDLGSRGYPSPFGTLMDIQQPPFSTYDAAWHEDDVVVIEVPGQPPREFRAGSVLWATVGSGTEEDPILTSGFWNPGTRAALGIRFEGADGEIHYGWLDITVTSNYSLMLNGWAYETEPGKLVTPYAIPEPSSLAVVGLAAAGASLSRRRKRG